MFPPFDQELARHYCMEFISGIEDGSIILKQISKESEERKGHGVMVGALVCVDAAGQRVVLQAVSGISVMALRVPQGPQCKLEKIIVPPLVPPEEIEKALEKNDKKIHELTYAIEKCVTTEQNVVPEPVEGPSKKQLEAERTQLTTESLLNVFNLYTFTRFDGKKITLNEIIKEHGGKLPPTGTGDCCAPKLLSYAFEHGLTPISMDEVFYGRDTPNKKNGVSYPPCDERCGYILPSILGLEILYRDSSIIVINKQSGLLSVPGRTADKQDCVVNRVKKLFPNCITQPSVHRLDMETSGLLVLAFTQEAHRNLSRQFEEGTVHKKYVALIDGVFDHNEYKGELQLKFRLDVDNRPHQIYDEENGKLGITQWEKEGTVLYTAPDGSKRRTTKIIFTPKTGRTHQLRLAASDPHGFGIPIVGDTLYGHCEPGERLMLHAFELEFKHPISGEHMHFEIHPSC
ncbi:MAG: RluA family pseudouridine synthase [Treponema sp.]|nr:RluA family pseudouridine synthase [Treponema sp.]